MRKEIQTGMGCLLVGGLLLLVAFMPISLLLLPLAIPFFLSSNRRGRSGWWGAGADRGEYGGGIGGLGGGGYGMRKDPILVLLAAMMRADGHIMRSELDYVKGVLSQLYPSRAREALLELRDILKGPLEVAWACEAIRQRYGMDARMQILQILYGLAQADGNVHPYERALLEQVAMGLGVDRGEYRERQRSYVREEPDHYGVLGITSGATNSEVRAAYRRLAQQWHPDRYAGQGEQAIAEASERFKQINEAYDSIRKLRGLK